MQGVHKEYVKGVWQHDVVLLEVSFGKITGLACALHF